MRLTHNAGGYEIIRQKEKDLLAVDGFAAPLIIGFHGKKHSGKSFARRLLRHENIEMKFADPMYAMLGGILSWMAKYTGREYPTIEDYMNDPRLKEAEIPGLGCSARTFLRATGTEGCRNNISQDFWINIQLEILRQRMEECDAEPEIFHMRPVVFTDVRFPNEIEALQRIGGMVIALADYGERDADTHASEQFYPQYCDVIIDNTARDPGQLRRALESWVY